MCLIIHNIGTDQSTIRRWLIFYAHNYGQNMERSMSVEASKVASYTICTYIIVWQYSFSYSYLTLMLANVVFQLPSTATMNLGAGSIMITNRRESKWFQRITKTHKGGHSKRGYNLLIITLICQVYLYYTCSYMIGE